jgi:HEAT repeat protein
MVKVLRDPSRGETARAACAWALGAALAGTPEHEQSAARAALLDTLDEGAEDVQRKAAWALGQLGARAASPALIHAVFVKREEVRRAALAALLRGPIALGEPERIADGLDVRGWVHSLAAELPAELPPSAWRGLEREIGDALADALGRHHDLQLRTLDDLDARADGLAIGPLTAGALTPADRGAVDEIGTRLLPALKKLSHGGDRAVAARALAVLAKLDGGEPALAEALAAPSLEVRLAALAAVAAHPDRAAALTSPIERALAAADWRERAAAAGALASPSPSDVHARLLSGAATDASGFVRESVARALGRTRASAARAPLERLARDEASEVREAARSALSTLSN